MELNLRQIFGDIYSKKAFQTIDGALRIVGKYGEIEVVGDKIDLYWKDISTVRRNKLAKSIPGLKILDNEAYIQCNVDEAVGYSGLLGIRRKRSYTAEQKRIMADRMRALRVRQS